MKRVELNIPLTKGKNATLTYPSNITEEDIEIIQDKLDEIKPYKPSPPPIVCPQWVIEHNRNPYNW